PHQRGKARSKGMEHHNDQPSVLPKLPPLRGWADLPDPRELLPLERREKLRADLDEIVRQRRRAEARAGSLRLS
ncbi:MAG: hypothetical protein ACREQ5_25120, partial [Candidatus Dormibacteria bacterium]